MQIWILTITVIVMILISYFFISAIRSTRNTSDLTNVEGRRSGLILGMVGLGVIVTLASLWNWPHAILAQGIATTVNATGSQWYWDIDTEEVPLGKLVIFNVHTADVTHGLGVMDPDGTLLFQTQAMPGYVNKVEYTFNKEGEYRIVCLEFCGVGHHDMITEFMVKKQENRR